LVNKPKKLPGSPILLVIPSGPVDSNPAVAKRKKFWNIQLGNFGKVIPLAIPFPAEHTDRSMNGYRETLVEAVQQKVAELKDQARPLVLIGWDVGSLVACQIAAVESVAAVVCLGFPLLSVHGARGDVDDPLLDNKTTTMFVVGQHASASTVDDVEDLREKMKQETSLVVVGGSDDCLRMSHCRKKIEGMTQSMVDKAIQEKIGEFLFGVFTRISVVSDPQPTDAVGIKSPAKKKRGSSPTSEGRVRSSTMMGSDGQLQYLPGDSQRFSAGGAAKQEPKTKLATKRKYSKADKTSLPRPPIEQTFNSNIPPFSNPQQGVTPDRNLLGLNSSPSVGNITHPSGFGASATFSHITGALTGTLTGSRFDSPVITSCELVSATVSGPTMGRYTFFRPAEPMQRYLV
jgi:regulatory NSL complex subunit 3